MKRYALWVNLLLMIAILFLPAIIFAHGGEDHGGESLAGSSGSVPGAPIPVPVETQILMGVKTDLVRKETLPKRIKALGRTRIRPELEAVVTSPVEGRLVGTEDYAPPQLGDRVRKGQIIAVVDQTISAPETINLTIERTKIRSELRQARLDLDLAQKEYERVSKLKDVIPEKEIWRAESALTSAREKHDGLQKQGAVYETSVDQSRYQSKNPKRVVMRAPLDGIIAGTHVTLGEYVRPEKELYHIIDLSEALVEAEVFENAVSLVSHATSAKIIVEAYPNDIFTGKLITIGTTIDPQTRTLRVLFSVPNPDHKLVAEMFADVFIETGESFEGLTIPKTALVNQDGQSVIYVKTSGEQFIARPVIVAERYLDRVMLSPDSGLSAREGERIVIQGMYQIRMSASKPAIPASKNN
ncbi:MAG: efflux RND transporter periplasmic adaptor subunit [Desulfosalsimonadaceae bacterium]|nr:efflux RND transporter periplasmic adaptor subunit [Desulfosalsimonadaceae bacterium]